MGPSGFKEPLSDEFDGLINIFELGNLSGWIGNPFKSSRSLSRPMPSKLGLRYNLSLLVLSAIPGAWRFDSGAAAVLV